MEVFDIKEKTCQVLHRFLHNFWRESKFKFYQAPGEWERLCTFYWAIVMTWIF